MILTHVLVLYRANIGEVSDTEYQVRGLTNGKEYEFRVAAVNAAGPGEFCETSEAIKARPPPGEVLMWLSEQWLDRWGITRKT